MWNYAPVIPKADLKHGLYYKGRCRNADIARWNGETQMFYHWRHKFGAKFVEKIHCPEDEQHYDVFVAYALLPEPPEEIPFNEG
jgi:hypothetical protein